MHNAVIAILLAASAGLSCARADPDPTDTRQPAPTGRLLIVADEWKPMEALGAFLRARGTYEVECVEQDALPPALSSYAAIFMYIHGRMHRPCEKALVAYAEGGGRLIILHHGVASARLQNPDWLRLTGIHIPPRDHPTHPWRVIGNTTHTLVNLAPGHYITTHKVTYGREVEYASPERPDLRGTFPAIDLKKTEVFLNQQFTDGNAKTVLFGFRCTDGGKVIMQDRSGWYKPAGKGWVFYLQPGHCESDFKNPNYCQIILNCLTWKPQAGHSD